MVLLQLVIVLFSDVEPAGKVSFEKVGGVAEVRSAKVDCHGSYFARLCYNVRKSTRWCLLCD